ncbi:unnamed protein product, partial [marine sediment metagenome]
MAKKKEIKNFTINTIRVKTPFTTNLTQKIATEHKFKLLEVNSGKKLNESVKKLTNKLNNAVTHYYLLENIDKCKPRLSEQKPYINKILTTAEHLEELLEKMGSGISIRLIRAIPNNSDEPIICELIERLTNDLGRLKWIALIANKEIPIDKGSNPRNPTNSFVWYLANIYEEETGLKAEVKHNAKFAGTRKGKNITT